MFLIDWLIVDFRFDWEDKLLEKTIKTDIKLDQHMTHLEEAVQEIKAYKNAFEEWKRIAAVEYENMKNTVDRKLKELHEWKRQWEDMNANEFLSHASMLQKTTYTRWGRTTCPGNGSESVYDGFTL